MSRTSYQITLFGNGKASVTVTGDDPAEVTAALNWVKQTYAELQTVEDKPTSEETRAQAVETTQEVAVEAPTQPAVSSQPTTAEEEVPVYAVHQVPIVCQQGKFGQFWSCHQRNPDGSFCTYRPPWR